MVFLLVFGWTLRFQDPWFPPCFPFTGLLREQQEAEARKVAGPLTWRLGGRSPSPRWFQWDFNGILPRKIVN